MRASVVRSTLASLLVVGGMGPRLVGAQAAPAPTPSSAHPAAIRARSAAFRDTVDRALDRANARDGVARDGRDPFGDDDTPHNAALARRIAGGLSVTASQPIGDFRRGGRVGFGVAGFASISADPAGILGLRLEGGAQNYGTTSYRTLQPSGVFAATQLNQTTSNDVYWFGVGPQVTIPLGPVRPYGFATVGGANFSTTSSLQYALFGDPYGLNREFQSTDLSNWALARAAGGGVRVQLGGTGHTLAFVDLGARWQRVGTVQYLAPGVIPAGVDPNTLALRGRADFVTYHLGVSLTGR